jgi:Tfp pilus assembly PilM family ATPase
MPRLIAIDLGSHSVKLSTYRSVGRSYVFEERYSQPVLQEGTTPVLEARLGALDDLLEEHPTLVARGSDVVAAVLPGEYASFHRVTLPFKDRAQVEKTLSFAVEAEVPFDLDEMVMGSRTLQVTESSEMLVCLARHDALSTWVQHLADRSMDPAGVYVDGEILGHFGSGGGPVPEGVAVPAVAVIDIGHVHTIVGIVAGDVVQHCRTINVGGYAFTRAIQQALGCDWDEAEARKHGQFQDSETTDPGRPRRAPSGYSQLPQGARTAMDGAIGLLLAEIRSTLIKAEDSLNIDVIEVRLVGGGSQVSELWDYLASDLGVSVVRAQDPTGESVPPSFAMTHAVAMEVAGQSPVDAIDLRLGDLAYRGGTDVFRAMLTYGVVGLAFFSLAAVVVFGFQYRGLSVEHKDATAELRGVVLEANPEVTEDLITDGATAVALMASATEDTVLRLEMLGEGGRGVPKTIDMLANLTSAFPPNETTKVEVSSLTISPTTLSFDAETDGFSSSAKVEQDLQANELFKHATKGEEKKLSNGRIRFPITIPLGVEEVVEDSEEG